MKYDPKVAWIVWIVLVVVLSVIVLCRFASLASGQAVGLDAILFLVWLGLLLAPMFPHVELFGLKLRQEIKEEFEDVKSQINKLSNTIQTQNIVNITQGTATLSAGPSERQVQATVSTQRSPMEYKILKTCWTKQVNRYDEWLGGVVWVFRINYPAPEFLHWREAATKLMFGGLVMETNNGSIHLTHQGFKYCKEHYKEFGEDDFWPQETIKDKMLKKVLAEL